jgi:hypothetical protein
MSVHGIEGISTGPWRGRCPQMGVCRLCDFADLRHKAVFFRQVILFPVVVFIGSIQPDSDDTGFVDVASKKKKGMVER